MGWGKCDKSNSTNFGSKTKSLAVVPLMGFFVEGPCAYLEFNLYPMDLARWAQEGFHARETPRARGRRTLAALREEDAERTSFQKAIAVAYVHSINIAHGDLKPNNFLLEPPANDHGAPRPLLCDFETADESEATAAGSSAGVASATATSDFREEARSDSARPNCVSRTERICLEMRGRSRQGRGTCLHMAACMRCFGRVPLCRQCFSVWKVWSYLSPT